MPDQPTVGPECLLIHPPISPVLYGPEEIKRMSRPFPVEGRKKSLLVSVTPVREKGSNNDLLIEPTSASLALHRHPGGQHRAAAAKIGYRQGGVALGLLRRFKRSGR